MEIKKAIRLQNERQREKNKKNGRPPTEGFVNMAQLARLFWPNQTRYQVSMSNLANGKTKTIKKRWVDITCVVCGVDSNFIHGESSRHDIDYNRLCK